MHTGNSFDTSYVNIFLTNNDTDRMPLPVQRNINLSTTSWKLKKQMHTGNNFDPSNVKTLLTTAPKRFLGRLISQHVAVPISLFQHQTKMSSTPQGLFNQRSRRSRTHPSHSKLAPSAPSKAPQDKLKRTPRRHPDPLQTPTHRFGAK